MNTNNLGIQMPDARRQYWNRLAITTGLILGAAVLSSVIGIVLTALGAPAWLGAIAYVSFALLFSTGAFCVVFFSSMFPVNKPHSMFRILREHIMIGLMLPFMVSGALAFLVLLRAGLLTSAPGLQQLILKYAPA